MKLSAALARVQNSPLHFPLYRPGSFDTPGRAPSLAEQLIMPHACGNQLPQISGIAGRVSKRLAWQPVEKGAWNSECENAQAVLVVP